MARLVSVWITLSLLLGCRLAHGDESSLDVFYLVEAKDGITLATVTVPAGETVVLGTRDEFVTIVLPVAVGKSGDLLQQTQRHNQIAINLNDGVVTWSVLKPDGSQRSLPPVIVADLRTWDIRLNVTGGNGVKRAFMIHNYDIWRVDDGPVLDMFAGRIPLAAGDWSIMTETAPSETGARLSGEIPLRFVGGFLVVEGTFTDGTSALFVVDLGADGTVVFANHLPEGSRVAEVKGVEHSPTGSRFVESQMQGATGSVDAFQGVATLDRLAFSDVVCDQVEVSVVAADLHAGGQPVAGILGYDLLRRAGTVSFGYGEDTRLVLGPTNAVMEAATSPATVPITFASDHLFVAGAIADTEVRFLIDTGARMSIVSPSVARKAGLDLSGSELRPISGLGDQKVTAQVAATPSLRIGELEVGDASVYVTDLPVFGSLGLNEDVVLLGNDLLSRFARIEIDFEQRHLRLWR